MKVRIDINMPSIHTSPNNLEKAWSKLEEMLPDKNHIEKLVNMPALSEKSERKVISNVIADDKLKGYTLEEWSSDNLYTGNAYFPIKKLDKIT